jgi:protein-S-isoprenylcysteine O-methyltransferase Ste14
MRASGFEFRHRFWFFILTFFIAYLCYHFDHLNASEALARWIQHGGGSSSNSPAAHHAFRALLAVSALLVAAAAGVRTWAGAYLRAEVVFDTKVHSDRLVAAGPYRFVRNPLYLGNMILAAGIALLYSRTGAVVLILGNLLIVERLIGREETALIESQGESYRAFLAAVPKLWPAISPRLPPDTLTPHWRQAFLGEAHLWLLALAGFVLAWRMDQRLYFRILALAGVVYFLMRAVTRRGRARSS